MLDSDKDLLAYAEGHSKAESEVLQELNRETHLKVRMPRMLSGPLQGNILALFVSMVRPQRILEIGTFTGYSAIWMASAMPETGILHTIDVNDELEEMVCGYFEQAGLTQKIVYHLGKALDIIPSLTDTFDMVFIDADKMNYKNYYELALQKTRQGGFIIADNVLWSGKVVSKADKQPDKDTRNMIDFNKHVYNDTRVENVLVPIRDGLMVARKL